jgi:hypothetical protein
MYFKAMSTPKSRTPKQNAQEAQTPTEAPVIVTITAATTATITAVTTATTTVATNAITTAATIATKTTTKKAKGRALPLERWHKRLSHLNYADVKQLATHSSQIKLANNKELFCEPCIYGK